MEIQTAGFDLVNWHTVILDGMPISTVYRGRAYYFENRENRDAFETNPDEYLAWSPMAGSPIGAESAPGDRPSRRRKVLISSDRGDQVAA